MICVAFATVLGSTWWSICSRGPCEPFWE